MTSGYQNSLRYHCIAKERQLSNLNNGEREREVTRVWNALDSLLKSRCIPQVPLYILLCRLVLNIYPVEYVFGPLHTDRLVCTGSHPYVSLSVFLSRSLRARFYHPLPLSLLYSLFEHRNKFKRHAFEYTNYLHKLSSFINSKVEFNDALK